MFGPLLLHVFIFCKLNYVFANGHLEIHRVLNCDARWSLPGRESVVWWWQATRAHFCWMAGWVEKLRTWCSSGLNVPFSCACHDHQPLCTHGEQIRKHSPEPQILFWSVPFFCMWNILNSEMDKFATCGHGRSMLPRMNFTTIYLEGITVIPNWHLLLLFYSVDYCANLWQLLFD